MSKLIITNHFKQVMKFRESSRYQPFSLFKSHLNSVEYESFFKLISANNLNSQITFVIIAKESGGIFVVKDRRGGGRGKMMEWWGLNLNRR